MEVDATVQHKRAVEFDFHTGSRRRRGPCALRRACAAVAAATPSAARRARGAARRAQAEAKAAKLKAELEEQYGIARARIEAAAADADTSPSPPPARRKPRRASARFRNLLDDVPEEPAAVPTAGAAGPRRAAARAQRDDVDVRGPVGQPRVDAPRGGESDDESIAPPDEPPPNVPEDAVALAE